MHSISQYFMDNEDLKHCTVQCSGHITNTSASGHNEDKQKKRQMTFFAKPGTK